MNYQGFMQRRVKSYDGHRSGTGFMQGTICVADRYPLGGDTGELTDDIGKVLDPNGNGSKKIPIGIAAGGAAGYLIGGKKHRILGIAAGLVGGYFAGSYLYNRP